MCLIKCRTYLGVIIYKEKEKVPGSDLRELKDGRLIECAPIYDTWYKYTGGIRCYTLQECKESIDSIFRQTKDMYSTEKEHREAFVKLMNEE